MDNYIYCPYCKQKLTKNDFTYTCPKNHKIYINPATTVSLLPVKNGEVLFAIRGIEPYKGDYDFFGGFMNPNETAESAARREFEEETGLKIKSLKFFRTYPERYGKNGQYTLNIVFVVQLEKDQEPIVKDDVQNYVWVPIADLWKVKSGFKSIQQTLKDFGQTFGRG